ncbi:MAG TPA: hypothetical protein VF870_09390 [Ignavibacteriaceae bacterium]|jgi:hypothetical protein
MKYILALIMLISAMLITTVNAQDQSTRYEEQHHSKFIKSHLPQTEEMLLKNFTSNDAAMLSSNIQTLRELEEVFPENKFSSLIDPLMKIVQDEKQGTQVRILAALALDDLHSDKGDKSIYGTAKSSKNQSVKDICAALAVESFKFDTAAK